MGDIKNEPYDDDDSMEEDDYYEWRPVHPTPSFCDTLDRLFTQLWAALTGAELGEPVPSPPRYRRSRGAKNLAELQANMIRALHQQLEIQRLGPNMVERAEEAEDFDKAYMEAICTKVLRNLRRPPPPMDDGPVVVVRLASHGRHVHFAPDVYDPPTGRPLSRKKKKLLQNATATPGPEEIRPQDSAGAEVPADGQTDKPAPSPAGMNADRPRQE